MNDVCVDAVGRTSILIADDTPANLDIVLESLEEHGFRVLVALDGIEAIERARFSLPDLILLDVKIPGIDGFETCRRLKRIEATRDIPVVFMTALAGSSDMIEGFAAGGVDYVTKPVQVAEMVARIGTHLRMRALHKQLVAQNRRLQREIGVREQTEAELRRMHDELERRVEQRTSEIARVNASLHGQIDERRRAEAKLQASEARFRTIVETSPVPLCITTMPEGAILYTNQPLRALFGLDILDTLTKNIRDLYAHPAERDALIAQLRREGSFRNTEVHFRRSDGTTFWAIATARVATYGDAPAIYVGLNDVTERREAAERLRASEASLANAQRLASLGDWEWNRTTGVTRWSDEVYRILGLRPGSVRPGYRALMSCVHPDDRAAIRRTLRQLMAGTGHHGVDYRVIVDGTERIVQFRAEIRCSGTDGQSSIVGTLQDVTERKRIEQALRASREQLRELGAHLEQIREEERKHMAMEIHDELGQLLTALKMNVSLLRMRLSADPDVMQQIDGMRELVEKTIWMVRNVANHLRPAALNFGIVSALEWLAEDFSRRNGIPCHVLVDGGEPTIADSHATAIFRIAQESLTNVARHARASSVTLTLMVSDASLNLRVSDDGCGFDPNAAAQDYSYGLLGMSERARLIGESEPSGGTLISIYIPRQDGTPT